MPTNNVEPVVNGVVKQAPDGEGVFLGDYVLMFASLGDEIPAWGTAPRERDRKLREFFTQEPILHSAVFNTIARYVAFGWDLKGPERMVNMTERMLHGLEWGKGWQPWCTKFLLDAFTQDNGAFSEVVRTDDSPDAPVVTLKHLDSNKCIRTGRALEPVIYYDRDGVGHTLKWYQIIEYTEFPSAIEEARGMQYCAVSRLLKAAQIIRDITVYKREKIGGRFNREIHLVSGVQKRTLDDAIRQHSAEADSQGLVRYLQPLVIAALDPTSQVSVASIALASLPDGFDEDTAMKWYVNQLALAFAADYQDFAPLPGGNLGSAQQAETLHMKSRGKGPRLFMSSLEHIFNFHGIMPRSVTFTFGDQDVAEDTQHARMRLLRAQERAARITSGEISPSVARQIAVDCGDLDKKYLGELEAYDDEKEQQLEEQAKLKLPAPGRNTAQPVPIPARRS